jgi:hypothetical protein
LKGKKLRSQSSKNWITLGKIRIFKKGVINNNNNGGKKNLIKFPFSFRRNEKRKTLFFIPPKAHTKESFF